MAAEPDPRKLFEPDPNYERPFLSKWFGSGACAVIGPLAVAVGNYTSRRPPFSGIQKHISAALAGFLLGRFLDNYRQDYYAERDAVIRHYIHLHPEDFPPQERVKLKDMFKPWLPIR